MRDGCRLTPIIWQKLRSNPQTPLLVPRVAVDAARGAPHRDGCRLRNASSPVDEDVVRLNVAAAADCLIDNRCCTIIRDRAAASASSRTRRSSAPVAVLSEWQPRIDVRPRRRWPRMRRRDHACAHPSQADHAELHRDPPVRAPD